MTDFKKLDERIAYLEAHPEEHDQANFGVRTPCGTVCCLAGSAALQYAPEEVRWRAYNGDLAELVATHWSDTTVATVAAKILDLTEEDKEALFFGCQTLDEIKSHRDEMWAREQVPA